MNTERCFKLTNRLVAYLAVVAALLSSTGLLDQTACKLQ